MKVKIYHVYDANDNNATIMFGGIEDVRKFVKAQWSKLEQETIDTYEFVVEEDYYSFVDNDINLVIMLKTEWNYLIKQICEISDTDLVD